MEAEFEISAVKASTPKGTKLHKKKTTSSFLHETSCSLWLEVLAGLPLIDRWHRVAALMCSTSL